MVLEETETQPCGRCGEGTVISWQRDVNPVPVVLQPRLSNFILALHTGPNVASGRERFFERL
jgi:hypothetical protein